MQVELRDGSKADVYEHGMTLEIVALRGSVPQQWVLEFRYEPHTSRGSGVQSLRVAFKCQGIWSHITTFTKQLPTYSGNRHICGAV